MTEGVVSLSSTGLDEDVNTFDDCTVRPRMEIMADAYTPSTMTNPPKTGAPISLAMGRTPIEQRNGMTVDANVHVGGGSAADRYGFRDRQLSSRGAMALLQRSRVLSAGPTNDVITIEDCTTTLLFPFVTNQMQASIPDWPSRMPRRDLAPAPSTTAVPMLLRIW